MNRQNLLKTSLLLIVITAPIVAHAAEVGATSGRLQALIPLAIGIISIILGRIALKRNTTNADKGRIEALAALIIGVSGIVKSSQHLVNAADAALGTGSGKLGATVALVVCLVGVVLGGIALVRSLRKNV